MKIDLCACRAILPLLWDYAEAALPQNAAQRVSAHLQVCEKCAAQAKAYQQTVALMHKGRALPLRDTTGWSALRARLESEAAPVPAPTRWQPSRSLLAWSGAFATLALAVVTLALFGTHSKREAYRVSHASPERRVSSAPFRDAATRLQKVLVGAAAPFSFRAAAQPVREAGPPPSARKQAAAPDVRAMDDMAYLNPGSDTAQNGTRLPSGESAEIQAGLDRVLRTGDDFVLIPFPQIASKDEKGLRAAARAYKQQKEIIDARLARKVTLAAKGVAFVDFCRLLRGMTGIEITAGRSIANEKLTVFCKDQPLRDLMRQTRQVFGFTWLRSDEEGVFRYELVQSMRRQLEEEELRNRDRAEALLDLNAQLENYRKNLNMSPEEAAAKYNAATGEEKQLLWAHQMNGSGPAQLFLDLSADELDSLRNGQQLMFSGMPSDNERALPPGIGERLLNHPDSFRLALTDQGAQFGPPAYVQNGKPLSEFPGLIPTIRLSIQESEPGRFELVGGAGVKIPGRNADQIDTAMSNVLIASGLSPSIRAPQNALVNAAQKAAFQKDAALKGKVTIQLKATCELTNALYERSKAGPCLTSADALEALHKATGQSVIADYFTRVYAPDEVSVTNLPLFDALCRLADTMRLRWKREGGWLQFRSVGYFNENRMEVSNASLNRWAASRREHGALTLNDLIEIAQLTDAQLNSDRMSGGARAIFGLKEWPVARNLLRRDLRFLALLTPQQCEAAVTETGVPFAQMSAPQQVAFCELCMGSFVTAEQVADASIRVRYLPPVPAPKKDKQSDFKPSSISENDPDRLILYASAARVRTWESKDAAILQIIYRYLSGRGKRANDNFGSSQEYNGKIFDR